MKNIKQFLLLFFITIFFSSCGSRIITTKDKPYGIIIESTIIQNPDDYGKYKYTMNTYGISNIYTEIIYLDEKLFLGDTIFFCNKCK